jgi:hypothetical protein
MNSALSAKQQAAKLMRVSAIRDDFIKRVRSTGQTCALGAPAMLVHDVASFGAYDEAATRLQLRIGQCLVPVRRRSSFQTAGAGADETAAQSVFEGRCIASCLCMN